MFQFLLCLLELLVVRYEIHVSEHAHDAWEAVNLANVQELERLHLEAETGVDHEQHEIGHFGGVDHRVDVVVAFVEGDAAVFARHNSHRAFDVVYLLLRVVLDEGFHESRFADL